MRSDKISIYIKQGTGTRLKLKKILTLLITYLLNSTLTYNELLCFQFCHTMEVTLFFPIKVVSYLKMV